MNQVGNWIVNLWKGITRPRSENLEQAQREQIIRTILLMFALAQALLTLVLFPIWMGGQDVRSLLVFLGLDVVLLMSWWLIYLGHPFLAGSSFAGAVFLAGAFISYTNGVNSNATVLYALCLLMFSLFIGSTARWVILILSVFTHIGLGMLNETLPAAQTLGASVSAVFTLVAVAIVEGYYSYLLKKVLSLSQQAEEKLRAEIVERTEMEERLKHLSTHDALTGLFNRAFFEAELDRLGNSRLYPICLIMADVDGLKRYNDRLGHAAGDALLVNASKVMSSALRGEDILARIGGDEFAILLPGTNPLTLRQIITRLRKSLDEYNHLHPDRAIEISLGAATAEAGADLRRILQQADDHMYEDKFRRKAKTGS